MKAVKTAVVCLVCALLIALPVSAAINLPAPTERFFVNDYASVLDQSTEDTLFAQAVQLYERTGAQVVITTVPSLNGAAVEDYALQMGRDWGIGDKKYNNGLLLLFAKEEREVRVEVGYGLEGAVTDTRAGIILDTHLPEPFGRDDFNAGLSAAYTALIDEVFGEYELTRDEDYQPLGLDLPVAPKPSLFESIAQIVIFLLVIGTVIYLIATGRGHYLLYFLYFFGGRGGGYRGGGGGGFSGGGDSFGGGGSSRKY